MQNTSTPLETTEKTNPSWMWYQQIAQRLPGMATNHSSRPKSVVYDDIRLLGALLGEIIAQEHLWQDENTEDKFPGEAQFFLIEELRRTAKKSRITSKAPNLEAISQIVNPQNTIDSLPAHLTKILKAVDAFRIFLELASLTESYHQTKGTHLKKQLTQWVEKMKADGTDAEALLNLLKKIDIRLVSTAHPTQIFRLTYLEHHQKVIAGLKQFYAAESTDEQAEAIDNLSAEVLRLWLTGFVRWEQPTVYDEAKALRHFLEVQRDSIASIHLTLATTIQEVYQLTDCPVIESPLISVGSWVGGDMDGNPNTRPDTLASILSDRRWDILKYYHAQLNTLAPMYSFSSLKGVKVNENFKEGIKKDLNAFNQLSNKRFKYSSGIEKYEDREAFRQKLLLMAAKMSHTLSQQLSLSNLKASNFDNPYTIVIPKDKEAIPFTYQNSNELIDDLQLLMSAGKENHLPQQLLAPLYKLLSTIKTFGFYYTGLDLREDAGYVKSAALSILGSVDESLLANFNDDTLYQAIQNTLTEETKLTPQVEAIQAVIKKHPDCFTKNGKLEARINAMVRVMKLAQIEISEKSSAHLLLSMTHSGTDILSALFILKTHQLVSYNQTQKTLSGTVDIVPLFETIDDLNNAPEILENLFKDPLYRNYLESRGNIQKVLMAYSDSNKDGGFISSRWHLQQAQINIMTTAKKFNLRIQFYHGRGGSIGRGGGPTRQNMMSLPMHSIDEGLQITEQGEVLARYYLTKESTLNHFTNLITASVDKHNSEPFNDEEKSQWHDAISTLSKLSEGHYRSLKGMAGFVEYFNGATPREIEQIYIGSRPSHRKQVQTIDDLRAIPWVFRWSQSRTFIPGWYGVGFAIASYISQNTENLTTVKQMYADWPFFTGLLDNCAEALCQSDIQISKHYKTLLNADGQSTDNFDNIFKAIETEYHQAVAAIKQVTEKETLLATTELQKTRNSIEIKRAYLDPLNYLQVYLLDQFRSCLNKELESDTNTDEEILSLYQRAFISSTGGIVAGLGVSG